jgi:hypothetical protein
VRGALGLRMEGGFALVICDYNEVLRRIKERNEERSTISDAANLTKADIFDLEGAYIRYTTIQNWSNDVYNLVTKRAHAYADATVEWIDANTGSRQTMKYPSIFLRGEGATAEVIYSLVHYLKQEGQLGQREDATVSIGPRQIRGVSSPVRNPIDMIRTP